MKILVTNISGDVFTMDVSPDLELLNFKALCEFECGVSTQQCVVIHNGVLLKDPNKTLGAYGVKDGDMILLQQKHSTIAIVPLNPALYLPPTRPCSS